MDLSPQQDKRNGLDFYISFAAVSLLCSKNTGLSVHSHPIPCGLCTEQNKNPVFATLLPVSMEPASSPCPRPPVLADYRNIVLRVRSSRVAISLPAASNPGDISLLLPSCHFILKGLLLNACTIKRTTILIFPHYAMSKCHRVEETFSSTSDEARKRVTVFRM